MAVRFSILFLTLFTFLNGQYPEWYYYSAYGLTGEELRTELEEIIDDHSAQDYDALWTHFQTTDNLNGNVWDMYSYNPGGSSAYTYSFGTNQCGNYSGEGDCYNREHSMPKSWFNDAMPMYTDLFHLYPTDGYVNGQRGNNPFGEVGSASWTSTNGSKVGSCNYPGYSGTVFEPIDEYKGDFARTYFYMMTRYKDVANSWSSAMISGNNLSSWAENMLYTWHVNDPVDQKEEDRNNAIYTIQGNRNPFIDKPHWVEKIWGPTASITDLIDHQVHFTANQETLRLENETMYSGELKIVNMLGEVVAYTTIQKGSNTIALDGSSGVYFAQLMLNNQLISYQFIK